MRRLKWLSMQNMMRRALSRFMNKRKRRSLMKTRNLLTRVTALASSRHVSLNLKRTALSRNRENQKNQLSWWLTSSRRRLWHSLVLSIRYNLCRYLIWMHRQPQTGAREKRERPRRNRKRLKRSALKKRKEFVSRLKRWPNTRRMSWKVRQMQRS